MATKYWKNKFVLDKIEATYNTDPTPTGAANSMLLFNVAWNPMLGSDVPRDRELPWFSSPDELPAELYAEISASFEAIGHATRGTAPAWSSLMRSLGFGEVVSAGTSVVYNPVSSGHASSTSYINVDGVQQRLTGSRGRGKFVLEAGQIPRIEFTKWGIYNEPTDVALPTPSIATFQTPTVAGKAQTPTFTIGGVAAPMRRFEIDFGNQLVYRDLVNSQEVLIVNATPRWSAQLQADTMAALNPFNMATARTVVPLNLVHGAGSGKITTVAASNARMSRTTDMRQQDNIWEMTVGGPLLPTAGNDAFTMTLT